MKKNYIKPKAMIVKIENENLLAGSTQGRSILYNNDEADEDYDVL